MRRRISNRDSARRTRQRRNREMAALREKNEELQAGAEALRAQVADLVDANQALQASVPSDQTLQCAAYPPRLTLILFQCDLCCSKRTSVACARRHSL